ncbi:MAG: M14 family metallopeptidase [Gemmatimonadales bacterium]
MRSLLLAAAGLVAGLPALAQTTTPERTRAAETSSLAQVVSFFDSLAARTPLLRLGTFGRTAGGLTLPYVIAAAPMVTDPADAQRSGKPVVYLQGNIHGGEVEGKEAVQLLLRDLTTGSLRPLLDSVVLIIVPVYNGDGNDAFGPGDQNRRGQNGPAVVGRRPNAQGLDLNRDLVKQEAPETRALLALANAWDPDLYVDLHTTNGSYHGYVLTYSPGLNVNSSPSNDFVRDVLLPEVRNRMRSRHRQEVFWYGNFRNQDPDSLGQGWETFEPYQRYASNWYGMRNRMSILSEAYSNADFQTRIDASYNFVLEILRYVAANRVRIRELNAASARTRPDSVTIRSALAPPTMQDVIAELTERAAEGAGPFARRRRTGQFRTVRMPVFDRFAATLKEPIRAGYLLPPQHTHLVELLRRQGIVVAQLERSWEGAAETFRIDSVTASPNPFEGHRLVRVAGRWSAATVAAGAGWFVVPTDQRLGVMAAYLLEPAGEDGFVTWNLLDRDLRRGATYPIVRVAALPPYRRQIE